MAITDIQISEELETNAPSIKYSGNEGPKSPQEEMMMVDAMLEEEYEKYVYDLLEQRPDATPMSKEEFRQMVIGDMSGGQPLPNDPTKPVNPWTPKPQGIQMAAQGGRIGYDNGGILMASAPDPMDERNMVMETIAMEEFGKPLKDLSDDEIIQIEIMLEEMSKKSTAPMMMADWKDSVDVNHPSFVPDSWKDLVDTSHPSYDKNYESLSNGGRTGLPNRQMAAYGGIMGLDGRKRYGIGSWFQEEIMDRIKKNPEVSALVGGALVNQFGIPLTGTAGDRVGQNWIGDLLGGKDSVLGDGVWGSGSSSENADSSEKLFNIGEFLETPTNKAKKDSQTYGEAIRNAIGKNIIPAAGGIMAGLFTKNTESDTPGLPSDNTAMNIQNLTKTANLLDQKQGMAAGMNFLPAVSARKFTPEEMAIAYSQEAANGGRIGRAEGGLMDLGGMEKDYRAEGGFVPIGAKEKADDVPARLSVNEFVFTADAVRNAGGGDIDKGAEVMENVMKHLEAGGQVSQESQGLGGAREMFETSERLSEVI